MRRPFDPRTGLFVVMAVGLLAISLERPGSLALLAMASALGVFMGPGGRRWWRQGLLAMALLIWGTAISQGIFYAQAPRVSLMHIGPIHLYREGLIYGLAQSLRFVAVALAGAAFALRTPADKMMLAMMSLKVPFSLSLMGATALRFMPEVAREMMIVRRARAHRGRPTAKRSPLEWLRLEVSLLRPLVARSLRRAQNLAESLDTRGFDPVAPRTCRRPLKMTLKDGIVIAFVVTLTASVAGARLLFILYSTEALYIPKLRPLYGAIRHWL